MDTDRPLDPLINGQANLALSANAMLEACSAVAVYSMRVATTANLIWGYYGGRWGSNLVTASTLTLAASTTNYVVLAKATGVVSVSAVLTNWNDTTNYLRLYLIVTGASTVTSYQDHRFAANGLLYTSPTVGTPNGSTGQLQFNSTGAFAGSQLWQEDSATIAQRNGATAQNSLVYNLYTSNVIYERARFGFVSNVLVFGTEYLGGGTVARNLSFETGGLQQILVPHTIAAVNWLTFTGASTTTPVSIGADGSDANVGINLFAKGTGYVKLGQMSISTVRERATITAAAATGTLNFDVLTQGLQYYTVAATANWTLNLRGDGTHTLDSQMAVGDHITVTMVAAQGATPYYNSAVQIDGTTTGVTTRWQAGAPTGGNPNSYDFYSYSILKTAAATFSVSALVSGHQ